MSYDIQLLPAINHIVHRSEKELSDLIGTPVTLKMHVTPKEVNEAYVQYLVCEAFGVSWQQILGTGRYKNEKNARFVYCWLCIKWLNKKLADLAKELHRHHTTIMHARDTVNAWLESGDAITQTILSITKKLSAIK